MRSMFRTEFSAEVQEGGKNQRRPGADGQEGQESFFDNLIGAWNLNPAK